VLLGPVTFLKLGKTHAAEVDARDLLAALLPVYAEVLRRLADAGADWVQIDEPCLVLDLDASDRDLFAAPTPTCRTAPRCGSC
jgi:5-methyltetrahydropteroyltriglutamate--homocysteine methyltransferase